MTTAKKEFRDRLRGFYDATVIDDIDPYQGLDPIVRIGLAAFKDSAPSAGEIMVAQAIDERLIAEGVQPFDEVTIIAWSGGAQMALGAASIMKRYVNHVALIGGIFMVNRDLGNIGSIDALFGTNDHYVNVLPAFVNFDRWNRGYRQEPIIEGYYPSDPEFYQENYYPALDLYTTGRIREFKVATTHHGYFKGKFADRFIYNTRVCKNTISPQVIYSITER